MNTVIISVMGAILALLLVLFICYVRSTQKQVSFYRQKQKKALCDKKQIESSLQGALRLQKLLLDGNTDLRQQLAVEQERNSLLMLENARINQRLTIREAIKSRSNPQEGKEAAS